MTGRGLKWGRQPESWVGQAGRQTVGSADVCTGFSFLPFSLFPSFFFSFFFKLTYSFYVCEYTVAVQMVVSLHCWEFNFRTSARSSRPRPLSPKDLFIIIHKCMVADFRCTRTGR
jgi:hypothetical protein